MIQHWLQGLSSDTITTNNGLSAGAVTNTLNSNYILFSKLIQNQMRYSLTLFWYRHQGHTPPPSAIKQLTLHLVEISLPSMDIQLIDTSTKQNSNFF